MMRESIFKLKEGRSLSYAIFGRPEHRPVLYFHGTPSSRLEPMLINSFGGDLDRLLDEAGLQLIAVDRPGMAFSTFNPAGNFLSFANDVLQLMQAIGLDHCPVLCWSGGGPYALAAAHQLPQHIESVHIICGFTRTFGPDVTSQMGMNRWYFYLARNSAFFLRSAMNVISHKKTTVSPPRRITGLPHEDYRLIQNPMMLEELSKHTLKQATRFGSRGAVYEANNYYRDFGFSLENIHQPIHYWWGTKDMTVIRLHPEALESRAPHPVMHYREGEGHLSLYIHCFKEILQTVASS